MTHRFFCVIISKNYILAFILLSLVIFGLTFPNSYHLAVITTSISKTTMQYDVILDPGHGGIDSGGRGGENTYEKDITLDIVLQMKEILENAGLTVGLTRDSDTDATHWTNESSSRHRRDLIGRFKALHGGKLGMSVHVNAAKDTNQKGAIVFYHRNSYIDHRYAQAVFDQVERVQTMNHTFVVPRSNLMLLKVKPPVIMVEIGFLSNELDYAKLIEPTFRKSMAEALSQGILSFFSLYALEQTE